MKKVTVAHAHSLMKNVSKTSQFKEVKEILFNFKVKKIILYIMNFVSVVQINFYLISVPTN